MTFDYHKEIIKRYELFITLLSFYSSAYLVVYCFPLCNLTNKYLIIHTQLKQVVKWTSAIVFHSSISPRFKDKII
jgi:hypothetical protein